MKISPIYKSVCFFYILFSNTYLYYLPDIVEYQSFFAQIDTKQKLTSKQNVW